MLSFIDKVNMFLHPTITINAADNNSGISMELAMQWNDSYHEKYFMLY